MFILKKDRKPGNILTIALILASALFVDVNLPSPTSKNLQEARFLGIGLRRETSPCTFGVRVTQVTLPIFWIQIGDSWSEQEPC